MKTKMLLIYLPIIAILLSLSCSPTEPEKQKLEIAAQDVSCTEAWLKVNGETGSEIILNRDDIEVMRFTLTSSPQTIYDDSLLPNKTYSYQATGIGNQESSSKITVTTLDTTSHNFSWQTWFLGDISSSTLYDCAIISEDNIWCVGEINIADTSENGYTTYNAIHWNGNEWELKKNTVNFRGNLITPPLEGVFAFSSTDIWFVGSLPIHGDGKDWTMYDVRTTVDSNLSLSKAWGISSDNIYFVGLKGSIAHYQNGVWTKIETGTDLTFMDIYGAENSETGKEEILAVCSRNYPLGKGIYKIEGNTATEISSNMPSYQDAELFGVWFIPERHYYIAGDGIYEKNDLLEEAWSNEPLKITHYATTGIRGNGLNDVYSVGAFGEVLHFNGVRWKSFMNETGWFDGAYNSVVVKGNIIIATGGEGQQAKILMGKRTN